MVAGWRVMQLGPDDCDQGRRELPLPPVTVRVKLKATVVHHLGDALADTISAESYQHSLAQGARSLPEDEESVETFSLPQRGDIVGGQYRLRDKLGEGMFGSVYIAERTDVPEHRVALKLINRDVYGDRDVERELVMLAAATHPNIVELKDHGMTEEYVWLTMPLYEGETLTERLERGTLGLREAYEIFLPVVRGVEALHARGLRHQDIKPENIYLARFATHVHPVLLDLGVAVENDADFVAGTALYGSPEQLAALGGIGESARLTEKMDTYCLASTLLYALVGEESFPGHGARTPFDITNAFEIRATEPLAEHTLVTLTGEPRQLLVEAFQRWMTQDPKKRPSAGEMAVELDVLLEKERAEARAEQARVRRQKANLQRLSFALVASLIVVGAGIVYGVSKAETLRLADELEKVRTEGAKSFDKLETCSAEYNLTNRALKRCSDGRDSDARVHAAAVSSLETEKTRWSNAAALANGKLKTCEEGAESLEECEAERDKLKTEQESARATCEAETEQLQNELAACQNATPTRPGLRPRIKPALPLTPPKPLPAPPAPPKEGLE